MRTCETSASAPFSCESTPLEEVRCGLYHIGLRLYHSHLCNRVSVHQARSSTDSICGSSPRRNHLDLGRHCICLCIVSDTNPIQLSFEQFLQLTDVKEPPSVVNSDIRTLLQRVTEIQDALLRGSALEQYTLIMQLQKDVQNSPFLSSLYVPNENKTDVIADRTTAECLSHACKWVGPLRDCNFKELGTQFKCPVCGNNEVFVRKSPK